MMRRPSPPRISQRSPPRRPPPPRSRGRRSPSADEVKIVNWGPPGSGANLRQSRSDRPAERTRSHSRSREKKARVSGDHDRHRDRERDTRDSRGLRDIRGDHHDMRDKKRDNPDHHRDPSRNNSSQHLEELKEKLHHVTKPLSYELQSYQQSFSNNPRFEPSINGRFDGGSVRHLITPKEEPFLDPSDGFHHSYPPESICLSYNPPEPVGRVIQTPGPSRSSHALNKKPQKIEKPQDDRISRLEKLVETLVETQVTSAVQKNSVIPEVNPSLSEPFRPKNNPEIHDKKELIPSNSKFPTSMWLNSLHEECLERGFDEKTCIQYVRSKMTGIVKAWFKTVENYDFTWPELKLLITKTFPDNVDFASSLRMLVEREKVAEETITQYFFSKMYLCEVCKISGENAVSCLIDGLTNPFMKQDIRSCNFLTPEVLFSEYFSKVPDHDRIEHEVEAYQDYQPSEMLMDRERLEYQLDLPPRNSHGIRSGGPPPRAGRLSSKKEKCDTCKKFGHSTVDCRSTPLCYKCNKRGHIQAKCHSFVGLLTIALGKIWKIPCLTTCEIKGKQFLAHVDTGCSVVTITESTVKELGLRMVNSNVNLIGYGGAQTKVSGAVQTKLKIDEVEDMMLLLVVPDKFQDFPLIVGQDFLNQRNVAVFIHQGEVRVFKYDPEYEADMIENEVL